MNYHFEDFTESEYRKLIKVARNKWEFISFANYKKVGKICLWRHDIDISVHRAHRLAQIEADEGVMSTFFVHLHSNFYHFYEREITDLIVAIRELGHEIGLHFDPNYYYHKKKQIDNESIIRWLQFEKDILETIMDSRIKSFSLHNPDVGNWLTTINQDEVLGMVNTYGQYIREKYTYVSDSNGYWRFKRLSDVLDECTLNLHVLTHPGFWTPEPMSPRERVSRAIEKRAAKQHKEYDEFLVKHGRKNIL